MADSNLRNDALLRDVLEQEGYKVLGPVVIYSKLGQGGMGAVYKGRHLRLDLDVAVKVMAPPSGISKDAADMFVQRFLREARIAAAIIHQNLVHVSDVNSQGGLHYIVMEYVDGESAGERLRRKGKLTEREAMAIAHGAALGLAAAHAKGIIHRDIKPDNILITKEGKIKVSDLGLAKAAGRGEGDAEAGLTLSHQIIGTPYYMSPEQTRSAKSAGPASDVWSLGATLYQLLSGSVPWRESDITDLINKIRNEPLPDINKIRQDISAGARAILDKALRKEVNERYRDCNEMAEALAKCLAELSGGEKAPPELMDSNAQTVAMSGPAISPPPAETLSKIALAVTTGLAESETQTVPPVETKPVPPEAKATTAAGVSPAAAAPSVHGKSKAAMYALAIASVAVLALVVIGFQISSSHKQQDAPPLQQPEKNPVAEWEQIQKTVLDLAGKEQYDAAIGMLEDYIKTAGVSNQSAEARVLKSRLETEKKEKGEEHRQKGIKLMGEKEWMAAANEFKTAQSLVNNPDTDANYKQAMFSYYENEQIMASRRGDPEVAYDSAQKALSYMDDNRLRRLLWMLEYDVREKKTKDLYDRGQKLEQEGKTAEAIDTYNQLLKEMEDGELADKARERLGALKK